MNAHLPIVPELRRECGTCKFCCFGCAVPELRKPNSKHCVHECAAGCSIYDARPAECREYQCAWLTGLLPESTSLRPDNSGIAFDAYRVVDTRSGQSIHLFVSFESPHDVWEQFARQLAVDQRVFLRLPSASIDEYRLRDRNAASVVSAVSFLSNVVPSEDVPTELVDRSVNTFIGLSAEMSRGFNVRYGMRIEGTMATALFQIAGPQPVEASEISELMTEYRQKLRHVEMKRQKAGKLKKRRRRAA